MKKLSAILLAFALVFSSVGSTILFANDAQTVEAKSYKSGKKGFSNNNNNNSNIQKNNNDATNPAAKQNNGTTTKKDNTNTASNKGGLMKGLMLGGLAGLLFGSLFAGMGMLGNILGLLINVAAIAAIVFFLVKIYQIIKRKKDNEVTDTWKS
ncbi:MULTISPECIES: hypothetical protein [Solibacillus]|uniref:Preprotein translocase subunit Tim44 n=1 Tax=Solibacillus faecavium TaxID=2762221 RepID=A0ABR8XVZ6_9BACL|nr:hypothetical protein [Solibacillus faecavium]MBD8036109.1 hypothetical protein [Solibacillus faecavium]